MMGSTHCYTSSEPLVSVVMPTARKEPAIEILAESMNRQDYPKIQVIVADELFRHNMLYMFNRPTHFVKCPKKKEECWWNLDQSLNEAIRFASGEIIIELQDYIWLPNDAVSKVVQRHIEEGPCMVTGVGHQYEVEPVRGNIVKPEGKLWFTDPRMERKGFYVTQPVIWEANFGSFDRKIWSDIGGFDEGFDVGWGYDNVNFAERAQLAGYSIYIDTDIEVFAFSHIKYLGEQKARREAPNNQDLWSKKNRSLMRGETSYKLMFGDVEEKQ
jgi:glycosyltransferase involved in cell wall biosynthesis